MYKNVDDESCCWSKLFVYYSSICVCCSIRIFSVEGLPVRNYSFPVPCGENRRASGSLPAKQRQIGCKSDGASVVAA